MSKSIRMAELKKRLYVLIDEINSLSGGINIYFDQQPGSANHMSLNGWNGKMYVRPIGDKEYEIALSTRILVDEMGAFMVELCGKQHDRYNHPGKKIEPCWRVTDFEIVRKAAYRYAQKPIIRLPEETSLAPVHEGEVAVQQWVEENDRRAAALPMDTLKKRAEQAPSEPRKVEIVSTLYIRSSEVSNYAKQRAKGICDLCGEGAPFMKPTGEPFLESHHVEWISAGGSDSIDNVVALCPNCHRKMHFLNNLEDRQKLKQAIRKYGRRS